MFNISPNGYLPLEGEMDKMKIKEESEEKMPSYAFDSQKLTYIEAFIKDAKERGIRLIFVASPLWYGIRDVVFDPLAEECKKHQIPFYDYSNDKNYVHNDKMFKDGIHLNTFGADEFTKEVCEILK